MNQTEMKVDCAQLGITDCDWVVTGETAGDVVDEVVTHLSAEHGLDMPDADTILEGSYADEPLLDDADAGSVLIIRRLREALNIEPRAGSLNAPRIIAPPPRT